MGQFAAADALKINKTRFGGGDFAQGRSAVRHAPDLRRIGGRAGNAQFIARPGAHVDAKSIRHEIGRDVARMHGQQIDLPSPHSLVENRARAGDDNFRAIARLRLKHFGELRP